MKRILIIDDDLELLKALQMTLEISGYEVTIAGTVLEAAFFLKNRSFDLVVCDLIMPDLNGIEFQEKLREEISLPPFLFCSGLAIDLLEPPYPPGVVGFISKPFAVPELIRTMNFYLSLSELPTPGGVLAESSRDFRQI